MKKRKIATAMLIALLVIGQSLAACTIIAVTKGASADGSTMTSHTCDSTGDDLRLWLIPSMEEGTTRDLVVSGRKNTDFTNFPEVVYGQSATVVGQLENTKDTNQYLHAMYSFGNDKGLTMGESTCGYSRNTEQGQKLRTYYNVANGVVDAYMLQDLALENCSTAKEAVIYMGEILDEYKWDGSCEIFNIGDGEECWIMEIYGSNLWVAVRVPDGQVFVGANRARIDYLVEDDPENWLYTENIKGIALENGLWDGVSEFRPNQLFSPLTSWGCSLREWRVMTLLDSDLELDPYGDPDDWPLFVTPDEKVSVNDVWEICADYYDGTPFSAAESIYAGPYGDVLDPKYVNRPIGVPQQTYVQISNVKSWLPEEARCLVWFGFGTAITQYITPVFASANYLPEHMYTGTRAEGYNEDSGWWVQASVQTKTQLNFMNAIKDVRAVRDPLIAEQYDTTFAIQNAAAKMIAEGDKEGAVELLTSYSANQAKMWHELYKDLAVDLESKYWNERVGMRTGGVTEWWQKNVIDAGIK